MSVHDAIAAVPTTTSGDPVVKDLLHNLLIVRYPYVFSVAEDPQAWDAVDADTGSIPLAIVQNGVLFTLDPDDTTTAHDGTTTIVSNDGKRYKSEAVDFDVRSVLDKDLTAPPGSPTLGAAYIVAAGATGAWSYARRRDCDLFQPRLGLQGREEGPSGSRRGRGFLLSFFGGERVDRGRRAIVT
jgi:hypothetical protein